MRNNLIIDHKKALTFKDVYKVTDTETKITISPSTLNLVKKNRHALEEAINRKEIMYGITTGFGAFKNVAIDTQQVQELQENLILSHSVGVGTPFSTSIVRGMMFLMANYLSKGHSGVRPIVIETLIAMLNKKIHPVVPEKGSVGSSGDLAPSSHIILAMIGKGEVSFEGKVINAATALKKTGITPVILEAKEGLALINNTTAMVSNAVQALATAEQLINFADITTALSAEALRATRKAFRPEIHALKPHAGQILTAKRLTNLLKGSKCIDDSKTQDQYSLRCAPQIHGAIREAFAYAEKVVNTEINSVTDNPLIFVTDKGVEVISGGNFHGEPVAIALDTLGLAVCELANAADRRIASLLDPATNNKLPAFLTLGGGLNSGFMILQYTTAALVSENKILAHPASVDSIPTSANVEDLVSMGTIAARKANQILENIRQVLAIEAIVACQAIDFRLKEGLRLGKLTEKIYSQVRKTVPFFKKDAVYYTYFSRVSETIESLNELLN